MNAERRNSTDEMTGLGGGVGARHRLIAPLPGQGGYQNICTSCKFSKKNSPTGDLRLDELREIGLAAHWIDIAETIGIDNFLAMWAILSNCDTIQDEKHYAYVPRYSIWMRYQRNRAIMALTTEGLDANAIRIRINADLNELVSVDHIKRIIAKANARQ